ncbi:MAG TPA: peptidoglycan recognition protein [Acidimicrobiia bacterium]
MRVVSRREWGAKPAKATTPLQPARVDLFVLHHTTGSYRGARTVRQIQAFHQGPERGWSDVGYNFLIGDDGTVYEGRGWGFVGAHARGENSRSIGVSYVGDGSRPVPDAAKRAITELLGEAEDRFGSLRQVGHRDVGATSCPGDVLYRWWVSERLSEPEPAPKGWVAEPGQVAAESISERLSPIPDLRDGWRRNMARMGWLRNR